MRSIYTTKKSLETQQSCNLSPTFFSFSPKWKLDGLMFENEEIEA